MLAMRLAELDPVVDWFVLAEATLTHSGEEKPLYFAKAAQTDPRLQKYVHKIKHVVVRDMITEKGAGKTWERERAQLNAGFRGLSELELDLDDLVIVGDCDEIPSVHVLRQLRDELPTPVTDGADPIVSLNMDMYYFNFQQVRKQVWKFTKVSTWRGIQQFNGNLAGLRLAHMSSKLRDRTHMRVVPHGGWHLSYFLTPEQISKKIKSFGHQEFNKAGIVDIESIKAKIASGADLFERGNVKWDRVAMGSLSLPVQYKMLSPTK